MSIKWGILGASNIGAQFAAQLPAAPGAILHAVASRNTERANAFAANTNAIQSYGSYEALVADPDVDIIYVASNAKHHAAHTTLALEAGKAVLCEKPFALNAHDARRVEELAAKKNLFCMEAMWMRFHPLAQQLKKRIDANVIGDIRLFTAEAGYRTSPDKLASDDPGRGALLNFGVYGVSLAHYLFGAPSSASGRLVAFNEKVDAGFSAILHYPTFDAVIAGSVDATLSNEASVAGVEGQLTLSAPFFDPATLKHERTPERAPAKRESDTDAPKADIGLAEKIATNIPFAKAIKTSTLASAMRGKSHISFAPPGANGLALEAIEAMNCLQAGNRESKIMPLADTIAVLETLDAIRGS